ncbi:hypothetical protein OG562_26430 [Streptomyces sp. NBC_01275]|uniref:hypothetical protein n=1 Tax=Streptomyces sp. NBC_01275 TaxID=2903807 RepID=UPI00225809C8|nr:hypothetical protein [Streptomyces sp. NBC_01275]MCX4764433.1 hypothetical protein [Streptomyces sp. NBC_01275]
MKTTGTVLGTALAGVLIGTAALAPFADGARPNDALADVTRASDAGGRGDVILGESKDAIPSRTASDWISYGDQAAVVHVAAEHEGVADSEEVTAGEGYLSRTVDLQVKERVWARSGATALPDTLSIVVDGWEFKDDGRLRVSSQDASRMEVGHDYLVSFAHFSDGEWSTLGTGAILPYDGNEVGRGEYQGATVTSAAYRTTMAAQLVTGVAEPMTYQAAGKTAAAVKTLLAAAAPDATAAANYNLDAVSRARLVAKAAVAAALAADTFCRVAAPLATDAGSKYAPGELSGILSDLGGMTDTPADGVVLRAYAAQLSAGDADTWVGSAIRRAAATRIERACTIDVGDLLPNDTEGAE